MTEAKKKYFTKKEQLAKILEVLENNPNGLYVSDLSTLAFNDEPYIQFRWDAEEALQQYGVFEALSEVVKYDQENYGQVITKIGDPIELANKLNLVKGEAYIYDKFNDVSDVMNNWSDPLSPIEMDTLTKAFELDKDDFDAEYVFAGQPTPFLNRGTKMFSDDKTYFTIEEMNDDLVTTLVNQDVYGAELGSTTFSDEFYIGNPLEAQEALVQYGLFDAIEEVAEYDQEHFGEYSPDMLDPVRLANKLYYVKGTEYLEDADPEIEKILDDNWNESLSETQQVQLIEKLQEISPSQIELLEFNGKDISIKHTDYDNSTSFNLHDMHEALNHTGIQESAKFEWLDESEVSEMLYLDQNNPQKPALKEWVQEHLPVDDMPSLIENEIELPEVER